jgi:DUF971 family protein
MQIPTEIKLNKEKNLLTVIFDDVKYNLSSEYLRVHSPSAEVRGHSIGQEILQLNKQNVKIKDIKPVGNYAITLYFDDNHNSGIYSWSYLYELANNQKKLWQEYLEKTQKK